MRHNKSGIHIYKEKRTLTGRDYTVSKGFSGSLCISIMAVLWLNLFFSVFAPGLFSRWLITGVVVSTFIICFSYRYMGWKSLVAELALSAVFLYMQSDSLWKLFSILQKSYENVYENGIAGSRFLLFCDIRGEIMTTVLAVVLTVPVLIIWMLVMVKRKGKLIAILIAIVPFLVSSFTGYLPKSLSVWALILSVFLYFAVSMGVGKDLAVSMVAVIVTSVICFVAGNLLQQTKSVQNGWYMKSRAVVMDKIASKIDFTDREQENNTSPTVKNEKIEKEPVSTDKENNVTETTADRNVDEIYTRQEETPQGNDTPKPEEEMIFADMKNLDQVSSFTPNENVSFEVMEIRKPTSTVYYPESYGITYSDDSWEMSKGNTSFSEPLDYCTQVPNGHKRLRDMCWNWNEAGNNDENQSKDVLDSLSAWISNELESRAVYDVNPGITPEGESFVEYFLFENKRGFCVHFATTAVLMYRLSGFNARYVEGYAVPASAYERQDDGTYVAKVDGTMGHAWCEVWDSDSRQWITKEHTPSASVSRSEDESLTEPESIESYRTDKSDKAEKKHLSTGLKTAVIISASVLVCFILICIQAFVRRAGKIRRIRHLMRYKSQSMHTKVVSEIYSSILKITKMSGTDIKKPYDESALDTLEKVWTQIPADEWEWFYNMVMVTFFYNGCDNTEIKKMDMLYRKFMDISIKEMSISKRLTARYIYCMLYS